MEIRIHTPLGGSDEDREIAALLVDVFAGEGHSDRESMEHASSPEALHARGDLFLARTSAGDLAGIAICARPTSPARQVAHADEAELHLLAVLPRTRGQGIGAALVTACERRAVFLGFTKMVLSTQPAMLAAQRLYNRLGYRRNEQRDWERPQLGKRYMVFEKEIA
jgi:ribosomal protein S18 acetylase RimI-like enzyme